MNKGKQLLKLKKKCLECRKCSIGGKLIDGCISNVFSNMCRRAHIMVVGQNPGYYEVQQGIPFVGLSGKFFDRALKDVVGVDRKMLYISNVIRCKTPNNRSPNPIEIENCEVFLRREIEILKPKVVLTLGGFALQKLTGISGIMKCHGEMQMSPRYGIEVLPLLHPSPLNMNNARKKKMFLDDIVALKEFV